MDQTCGGRIEFQFVAGQAPPVDFQVLLAGAGEDLDDFGDGADVVTRLVGQ